MLRGARWSLPLLLATSGCALSWHRVLLPPQTSTLAYAAIQVWRHDSATYLADSRISKDSVNGVPATSRGNPLNDCFQDVCRVALSLAAVDSIRWGSATGSQTLHAVLALGLVVIVLAGVQAR